MGGGGDTFRNLTPEQLRDRVRQTEEKTAAAGNEAEISGVLDELLGGYNARDVELAKDRLGQIKSALQGSIDGTFDQLFGGSVAKHTYVDGLSDVDSLVLVNDSGLENENPQVALTRMQQAIGNQLGEQATVSVGRMAVTVEYADGMRIQLLPAIKGEQDRLRVPSGRREAWSNIDPAAFREVLSRRNEDCGGKLIPTIKLAKAISGTLPEAQRLSGYHMESLAIAAFKDYAGEKTTRAMLPAFFERARELVLTPIRDSTGQSVHVDDDLGPANSDARIAASHIMGRLAKRIRNATVAGSTDQLRSLFDVDE